MPVIRLALAGLQIGLTLRADVNVTPERRNWSISGVLHCEASVIVAACCWSEMRNRMFGCDWLMVDPYSIRSNSGTWTVKTAGRPYPDPLSLVVNTPLVQKKSDSPTASISMPYAP